jgi:predicted RecA/RadA family phage recombinase
MAQTAKAILYSDAGGCKTEEMTAPAAGSGGDVIQTADGKAAVVLTANTATDAFAAGDTIVVAKTGVFEVLKTASIALLAGGQAIWDRSAETAGFAKASGDFLLGTILSDAAAAATTVKVDLNVKPAYAVELNETPFTVAATDGLGVTAEAVGTHVKKLAFDAVAEVAMAAIYSQDTVPVADLGILEGRVAIYDIGDDAALDITAGLANGTHATDFDSVTEAVVLHLDGSDLSILAESDDGTTEVAAADTTVDAVDDTYFEFWIDCRNIDDIQIYINGVNVLPASVFKLDAATGPMLPIVHIEKTSNDTTADVRVDFLRLRSTDVAS